MPLSKVKQAKWMREYRKRRKGVIPEWAVQPEPSRVIPNPNSVIPEWVVQPNVYLQPMAVQPKSMVVQPNQYLLIDYCPDYNPISTHY